MGWWTDFRKAYKLAKRLINIREVEKEHFVMAHLKDVNNAVSLEYVKQLQQFLNEHNDKPVLFIVGEQFLVTRELISNLKEGGNLSQVGAYLDKKFKIRD